MTRRQLLNNLTPSYAFIGGRDANGGVERFNRTFKEEIIHGCSYLDADELCAAVAFFVEKLQS